MNKFRKTALAGAAASALLLNTLAPAFAATTLEISGNANDDNTVRLDNTQTTAVTQSNNANVTNNITATANTGDIDANRNAGGSVNVDTGNADVDVTGKNEVNSYTAGVDRCGGCGPQDATVKITGNTNDDNKAVLDMGNLTIVNQDNKAYVNNDVYAKASTGDVDANRNAGGDVTVTTGNAATTTTVTNSANSNSARVGGEGNGGGINAEISGNTNDDNRMYLNVDAITALNQRNSAYVKNEVTAKSYTGDVDARRNAGGDVEVTTGDADTTVDIANALNLNSAQVTGEGDGEGVSARIVGNANKDDNKIRLNLSALTTLDQDNHGYIVNDVYAKAKTGEVEASRNAGGSVMVDTGDADVDVELDTMANFNVADVDCDCLFDSVLAKIAGNTNDDNKISATLTDDLFVDQDNCGYEREMNPKEVTEYGRYGRKHRCGFLNEVDAKGVTGDVDAKFNAGDVNVDPSIMTGDANIDVDATTTGNANVYGNEADMELPFPDHHENGGVNVNISFDLGDLLEWLLG